jgi:hypothetical protein
MEPIAPIAFEPRMGLKSPAAIIRNDLSSIWNARHLPARGLLSALA